MKKKNATKNATIKNRKNGEKEKVQDDTTVTKIPFNSPHNREIVKISVNTEKQQEQQEAFKVFSAFTQKGLPWQAFS